MPEIEFIQMIADLTAERDDLQSQLDKERADHEKIVNRVCRWTINRVPGWAIKDGRKYRPECCDRLLDFRWVEEMTFCPHCGGGVRVV